jgi:hypothetical protein
MEAIRTSETSVYFNETAQHYIPKGSRLYKTGSFIQLYGQSAVLFEVRSELCVIHANVSQA